MVTQFIPEQVKGLKEAYEDIEKLNENARGIKIAAWITAISTLVLAIASVIPLLK
jgi:hypothetical protein